MSTTKKRSKVSHANAGTIQASVPGFVLLKVKSHGRAPKRATAAGDSASSMLNKVAKALSKPGLDSSHVFNSERRGSKPVYAYSVDPTDTDRFIQIGADGSRKVGRLVKNRFIEIKAPTAKAA